MKFKMIKDDWGVCKYEGELYDILVVRGSFSSNRPTGYNVYDKSGKCIDFFLTLKEAKECIESIK